MRIYLGNHGGYARREQLLLAVKRIISYRDPALAKTLAQRKAS